MNETPLERRRLRVSMIRKRIAVAAVALFIAVFGGITAQLASGHDPALSSSTSSTSSTSTAATQAAQPSQALAPVTTSQS
jgi:hypothetical protein